MVNETPRVSVVVALHNKSAFVCEALDSIVSQTIPPCEIIVVDDGSTDDSASKVAAYRHPGLTLIAQANAGVSVARNVGIAAATGDFVSFLDADDRYLPGFLASVAALARDYPGAALLGTGYRRFIDDSATATQLSKKLYTPPRGYVSDFYAEWRRNSFLSTISLAVRRSAMIEADIEFPIGERLGEDQDVWFRLAERYAVAFDPEVTSEYRIGVAGSATHSSQGLDVLPCYGRLATRIANHQVPSALERSGRRLVASHLLNVARARLRVGDTKGAWELVADPRARAHPAYLLRTGLQFGMASLSRGMAR